MRLHLRIPGWARGEPVPGGLDRDLEPVERGWRLALNGSLVAAPLDRGYTVIDREWQPGDVLDLTLPMPVRRVVADERVAADRGRVALERGPVVYCLEGVDHDGRVLDLLLPDDAALQEEWRPEFLGGVTVLEGTGMRYRRDESGELHAEPAPITAIPYAVWAHRGVGEMTVWIPRDPELMQEMPRPTLAWRSTARASHVWAGDSVDALHDQKEPASSADDSIPRHTFWDHRGTTEWLQYDFPEPTEISATAVYWFDDTGVGQCRVPESWRVLVRDGEEWVPVETEESCGTAADTWHRVSFAPVETDAIRLEMQLKPESSAGVLEWTVE
jgi:hypothetical protein